MGKWYTYSTRREQNIVAIIHIYRAIAISRYFVITKTLNINNVKEKWAYLNQYLPIKIHQMIYGTTVYIFYKMGEKYCGSFSYIWRIRHFLTILWSPRHRVGVTRNVYWCISMNIHPEKFHRFNGTRIFNNYKMSFLE